MSRTCPRHYSRSIMSSCSHTARAQPSILASRWAILCSPTWPLILPEKNCRRLSSNYLSARALIGAKRHTLSLSIEGSVAYALFACGLSKLGRLPLDALSCLSQVFAPSTPRPRRRYQSSELGATWLVTIGLKSGLLDHSTPCHSLGSSTYSTNLTAESKKS